MKKLVLVLLFFTSSFKNIYAQTHTLNGVFAGVSLTLSVIMGAGMNRNDEVFYFRPDGTFTNQLEKPDWQTAVKGKYTITGTKVNLTYTKGNTSSYNLDKDGNINAGSYTMVKLPTSNSVPPGFYKFNKISSFGGGSSGMTSVHASNQTGLYFDGKGNFSRNQHNATVVSGDGIGGGGSKKTAGDGTYSIKNGVLTLSYTDGHTEQHSFFSRPGYEPVMAAVDGNIYFMKNGEADDGKSKTRTRPSSTKTTNKPAAAATTSTNDNANTAPALQKAFDVQGGNALDAVNTVTSELTAANLSVVTKMDITNSKVRLEISQNGKLQSVEQLDGNTGWVWRNGKQSTLPAARASEMRQTLQGSVLALSSKNRADLQNAKTQTKNGNTMYVFNRNGAICLFIINDNGQLVGEGYQRGRAAQTSVYSDFRKVNGILLPFKEVQTSGTGKLNITYTNYSINPRFTATDWAVPAN